MDTTDNQMYGCEHTNEKHVLNTTNKAEKNITDRERNTDFMIIGIGKPECNALNAEYLMKCSLRL